MANANVHGEVGPHATVKELETPKLVNQDEGCQFGLHGREEYLGVRREFLPSAEVAVAEATTALRLSYNSWALHTNCNSNGI